MVIGFANSGNGVLYFSSLNLRVVGVSGDVVFDETVLEV